MNGKLITDYTKQLLYYLLSFLDGKKKIIERINRWGPDIIDRLKKFSTSGKMIRGSFMLFTQEMYGEKIDDDSFRTAAAIELLHSGLLIHDDIMDRCSKRRGELSIHEQYKYLFNKDIIIDSYQFGLSMGVCLGDIVFFLGFELLANLKNKSYKDRILHLFSQEFTSVGLGQMQDIYFGQTNIEPSEDDILNLYLHKTARYTYSLPFMIGGLLAEIDDTELHNLEKLGEYLGLIFQIKDDELGLYSFNSEFGKTVGSDIEEGKKTLFYIHLFHRANREEKEHLKAIFGKSELPEESIKYVRDLIIKLNIKHDIDRRINEYRSNAVNVISLLRIDNRYKEELYNIIEYNLKRTR